jgi:hypothetical protein
MFEGAITAAIQIASGLTINASAIPGASSLR